MVRGEQGALEGPWVVRLSLRLNHPDHTGQEPAVIPEQGPVVDLLVKISGIPV